MYKYYRDFSLLVAGAISGVRVILPIVSAAQQVTAQGFRCSGA